MNRAPDFRIQLTDEQLRKLRFIAKRAGLEPGEWLNKKAAQITAQLLCETNELSPKEAGALLGVSKYSAIRYFHLGHFPNAYAVNGHTIRIPVSDVEALKASRRVAAA